MPNFNEYRDENISDVKEKAIYKSSKIIKDLLIDKEKSFDNTYHNFFSLVDGWFDDAYVKGVESDIDLEPQDELEIEESKKSHEREHSRIHQMKQHGRSERLTEEEIRKFEVLEEIYLTATTGGPKPYYQYIICDKFKILNLCLEAIHVPNFERIKNQIASILEQSFFLAFKIGCVNREYEFKSLLHKFKEN